MITNIEKSSTNFRGYLFTTKKLISCNSVRGQRLYDDHNINVILWYVLNIAIRFPEICSLIELWAHSIPNFISKIEQLHVLSQKTNKILVQTHRWPMFTHQFYVIWTKFLRTWDIKEWPWRILILLGRSQNMSHLDEYVSQAISNDFLCCNLYANSTNWSRHFNHLF